MTEIDTAANSTLMGEITVELRPGDGSYRRQPPARQFTELLLAALDEEIHELSAAVQAVRTFAAALTVNAAELAYLDTPEIVDAARVAAAELHQRAAFRRDVGPALTARQVCRLLHINRHGLRRLLQDRSVIGVFDQWIDGLIFPEWQFDADAGVIRPATGVVLDAIEGTAWQSQPKELLAWMSKVTTSCFGERISAVDWIEEDRSVEVLAEVLDYVVVAAGSPRRSR